MINLGYAASSPSRAIRPSSGNAPRYPREWRTDGLVVTAPREGSALSAKAIVRRACRLAGLAIVITLVGLTFTGTALAAITSATIDNATLGAGRQTATITGTITCTPGESWGINGVQVIQGQRVVAGGPASAEGGDCTGEPQTYVAVVTTSTGKLISKGRASVFLNFVSFDPVTGNVSDFFVDGFIKF